MRRMLLSAIALLGLAASSQAGTIALLSGSQYSEPSQVLATVNTVIGLVNTNVANNGGGNLGQAITAPAVTSAINALSITAGATTVGPLLTVGDSAGQASDTNIGIILSGKGTGAAHLGGTTVANGSLRVPTVASSVNQLQISGGATGARPAITVGGSSVDTNIGIALYGNGTGPVIIGGSTTTLAGLQVAQTASAVNDLLITNGATGTSVALSANTVGADTNAGITLTNKGSGRVVLGAITTCSGTTTATCTDAQRFVASVTGLTTAAGGTSATAMTVTASAVLTSAVPVLCGVLGYSGTGQPIVTNVTPGTGSVSFQITNIAASGSLNATVPVACVVL